MAKIYLFLFMLALTLHCGAQSTFFYSNTVDHYETVVNGNQQWRYFTGVSEPDSNWRLPGFNDAGWAAGNGGIGYGDNDDATSVSICSSLYMRKTFTITDTSKITEFLLSIDYDDGFVAYLNNIEIARKNVGTPGVVPYYNTFASRAHEANLYRGLNAEYFPVSKDIIRANIKNGTNVLCVQIHNFSITGADNDLTALPYLMAGLNTTGSFYTANPSWFKPSFYSHLPILQVIANNVPIVNEPKKTMAMRIIDNGKDQNHLSDSAIEYSGKIGIELHGASSINFAQKSYGVTTYDTNGVAMNVKLLGFPSESDYILYGPYNDKSLMRNVMMYDLARKMGWYAPRCRFIEMFLDTQYLGVYVFMEKIKIDKNRVAISQVKPNHNSGDSLTGGYIFKLDWNADAGLGTWNSHVTNYKGTAKTIKFQTSDPNGNDITNAQRDYIESYIDSFEQNLLSTGMSNFTTGYRKYIDVGSFIDYFILYEITHNVDAYRASTYFFKNKASQGGKLVMGPLWDFNYSLGNANFCTSNDTNGWSGCTPNNTIWWFDALNSENYYRDQLRCRWTNLYNGLLSHNSINRYIDSVAAYLEVPQKRHFTRWPILGTDLYNGHVSTAYSQEITWMKNWYRGRTRWLNLFMPGWHNPCYESSFANRLMVTEINYNSDKNQDAGNWIEFYNNSSGAVSLNNFVLAANGGANAKKFGFTSIPAFSYLVVCEDTNLFKQVYPNVKNKIGNLNFGFQNNGGSIVLYDVAAYQVFNISYDNKSPWPEGADGGGKTLEHLGINNKYNEASNWFEGCLGGSPGRAYGRCTQDVNVTEICYAAAGAHNTGDWFELKNNGNVPKNMGGYVFKDDDNTHIYTFPSNFTIGAGEYYVVCADTAKFKLFHPEIKNRIGNFNFGLSNKSDAIRLYTNTGIIYQNIYYQDTAAPWPNGANGSGYNIELKNDTLQCDVGNNWSLGCLFGSPGKRYHKVCNPALSAKLTVSEINTNPPSYDNDGGWIELHNYDTLDLDLTDFIFSHKNNTDTAYIFKEGTTIKKNGYLLLCNDTAKFRKLNPGINTTYPLPKWKFDYVTDSLIVKDFNGTSMLKLAYNLTRNEYAEANGLGKTLELITDTSKLNNYSSWFTGCFGGSPAEAYKLCDKPKLVISEINYHSSPAFNQGAWFEIKNTDTSLLHCDNYYFRLGTDTTKHKFTNGIILKPQEYYAVSFDSVAFKLQNPFVSNVMYVIPPSWNNTKDIIRLFDTKNQLLNVQYADTLPYPLLANGNGFTLTLINDTLNPFFASSFATRCFSGSPGASTILPCNPALTSNLQISEINYRSYASANSGFWFELANLSNAAVPIQNWYITNSNHNNFYQIPEAKVIPANGFLVFVTDTMKFKQQHPTVTNFVAIPSLFNSGTDSIKIFDYRGFQACKAFFNNDINWQQGANGNGYTLEHNGTVKNATLNTHWKPGCIKGSPGNAYTPCEPNQLIISEINYKPSISYKSGQWLELKNVSSDTLRLTDFGLKFNNNDSMALTGVLAPSNYLVVSADSISLTREYRYLKNILFAPFMLDTASNFIQLLKLGELKSSARYNANNITLQAANGGGYTLELIHDSLNQTEESAWTTGCLKGSPGTVMLKPCNPALNTDILFTEINYRSDTFNHSGQWIELYNNGTQPAYLHHWTITTSAGKYHTFKEGILIPSKKHLVLSNDTALFRKQYPSVQNVSYMELNLNKASDTITLIDYSETLSCSAFFSSEPVWPQGPNGFGRTLESFSMLKKGTHRNDWKEGCIGGSPGEAFNSCADPLLITELNYAPDPAANDGKWIEFFHTPNQTAPVTKYVLRIDDNIISHMASALSQANEFKVLCSDTIAFNKYHPFISNKEILTALSITTGNHGLVVYDQNYKILQSLHYSSLPPWDTLANGHGYTLELIKDSTNYSNASNWKSYCKRGSAGTTTITPCGNAFGIATAIPVQRQHIYPNPASNELTIETPEFKKMEQKSITFNIINPLGKTVMNGLINQPVVKLNIADLASGIYFIQISDAPIVKFIKK